MSKSPKKPQAVIDAEAALEAKAAEVMAARERLSALEIEHAGAMSALSQARTDADAALPQCRLVTLARHANDSSEPVVIVRRTPSGLLVVRRVGADGDFPYKFAWKKWAGAYRQATNSTSTFSPNYELRDVPPEFMPEPTR